MPYFLKILVAPKKEMNGIKVPLLEGKNLIGRVNPPCAIQLEGVKVSKKHCAVVLQKDALTIEDLQSSNGVYLNGAKITHHALKVGDRFVIGEYTLEVTVG